MKYTFVALSFFINIPTLHAASGSSRQLTTSKNPISAKTLNLTTDAPKTGSKLTTKKTTTQSKPTTTKKPGHKAAATENTLSDLMVVGKAINTIIKSSIATPSDNDFQVSEPIRLEGTKMAKPSTLSQNNCSDTLDWSGNDDDGELAFTKTVKNTTPSAPKRNPVKITGGVDLSDWVCSDSSDDDEQYDDENLGEYTKACIQALYDPENVIYL